MEPRIETLPEKKLVGNHITMSFANIKTAELWRAFMPRRKEIHNYTGDELWSVEVYPPRFFHNFNPTEEFEKWAAIEVKDFENIPAGMEMLMIPHGLYAVFIHKGPASDGAKTYNYIFTEWLPVSEYAVDERPHFAIMGERYKQESPDSEEELWIPLKKKDINA